MNRKQIETIKDQVMDVLANYPETRNCDQLLLIQVWKDFYSDKIFIHNQLCYVGLWQLFDLPSHDAIKRVRAKIQNNMRMFPPTTWKVAQARRWSEDMWKRALGYITKGQV